MTWTPPWALGPRRRGHPAPWAREGPASHPPAWTEDRENATDWRCCLPSAGGEVSGAGVTGGRASRVPELGVISDPLRARQTAAPDGRSAVWHGRYPTLGAPLPCAPAAARMEGGHFPKPRCAMDSAPRGRFGTSAMHALMEGAPFSIVLCRNAQ
eukprot:4162756-Pyramimonas_sp.AAC.1